MLSLFVPSPACCHGSSAGLIASIAVCLLLPVILDRLPVLNGYIKFICITTFCHYGTTLHLQCATL